MMRIETTKPKTSAALTRALLVCRDKHPEKATSAHIRSIPFTIQRRIANTTIPRAMATTSIASLCGAWRHTHMTILVLGITIL